MKRAVVVVILFVLTGINVSLAQDQWIYSQFFMNPYVYNPAYAGVEGHTVFYGVYRNQYMGIEGAPTLSHLSFHTPLENNLAIGGMVYNESQGPLNTSAGKVTLGYILELDKVHYIRFGMSLGGGYTGYDPNQINVGLDPTFQNLTSNSFVTADFGVTYHFDHFNVGFAMPNLIGREVVSEKGFAPLNFNDNMMIKANYRGHINDNFAIEPHLIYRFSTVNMPQYEAALLVHIMHIAWAGASYRQDAGFGALVGIKIIDQWGLGFAYEIGNSELSQASSGTAEVSLGYHFGEKKKHHKHSHSFIKSHRKTREQRQREEARKQRLAEQRKEQAERLAAESRAAREAKAAAAAVAAGSSAGKGSGTGSAEATGGTGSTGSGTGSAAAVGAGVIAGSGNNNDDNKGGTGTTTSVKEKQPYEVVSAKADPKAPLELRKSNTGQIELGTTYTLTLADNSTKKEVRWAEGEIPKTQKRTIDRSAPIQERTLPSGAVELGVTYILTQANGSKTKVVTWKEGKALPSSNERRDSSIPKVERKMPDGSIEIGTTYLATKSDGSKFRVTKWEKSTSTEPTQDQIDPSSDPQERRNPDGTVEIGTTYIVTLANGTTKKEIRWEPVSDSEIEAIASNETVQNKPEMLDENTAKKGNHILELPAGHHVVAAQFKDFDEAENYSDVLFERGFHGTIVGYVSAVGEYFVVVHKGATPKQAEEEQKKWQKLKDLDHVYIFNVVD